MIQTFLTRGRHQFALVLLLAATLLAAGFPGGLPPAHAQFAAEYFLVIDRSAGTGARGALFQVDPAAGNRTLVSDFGKAAQGPIGTSPAGVVLDTSVTAVVIDRDAGTGGLGALFRVDLSTGARTLVSDFGAAGQGPLGVNPSGVALEDTNLLIVSDPDAGTGGQGAIFRVDGTTGARTLVSDFGAVGQGPTGQSPLGVLAFVPPGGILVTDPEAGTNGQGGLFFVDDATGARTLVSDFGDPGGGPTGNAPSGLTIDITTGTAYLVIDPGAGTQGQLFRVDDSSGNRSIVSDFGNGAQGPTGAAPVGVDVNGLDPSVVVVDSQAGTGGQGALFLVDPVSGNRAVMSDFGSAAQGPLGVNPVGVAEGPLSCPFTQAMSDAPARDTKMGILHAIRDKVLATSPAGQRYTRLFYAHAMEGAWLVLRNPGLRARTRAMVERFLPALQAMIAGQKVRVSPGDVAAADSLLQAFADKASSTLRADIRAVQAELRRGTLLRDFGVGLTLR